MAQWSTFSTTSPTMTVYGTLARRPSTSSPAAPRMRTSTSPPVLPVPPPRLVTSSSLCLDSAAEVCLSKVLLRVSSVELSRLSQTVYWILAASKGWIKQTYRKIMHTQNTQNDITGNDLV